MPKGCSLGQLRVRGKKGNISHKARNQTWNLCSIAEFQPSTFAFPVLIPVLSWVGCHGAAESSLLFSHSELF